MIILLNGQNLKHLKYSEVWYMDGTFNSCPFDFYQVYIIHASIHGKIYPLCYALLENKSKTMYVEMLKKVKELVVPEKLKRIIVDFEKAVIDAIGQVFENIVAEGCYFHWTQMIIKNMKSNNLFGMYTGESFFRDHFKMLLALPFLPKTRCFTDYNLLRNALFTRYPDNVSLLNFFKYFDSNFMAINGKKGYNFEFWNVSIRIHEMIPITNNAAEAYNKSLNAEFTAAHPNIVLFIQKVRLRDYVFTQEIIKNFSRLVERSLTTENDTR